MSTTINLYDVVEVETLQKIQDAFSEATGFAAITVDECGKPYTQHSGCSKYCSIIRHRDETKHLCRRCDTEAGLEALRLQEPYIYLCHSGFIDFAAPIIVNGQYLGSIMGGQVVSSDYPNNINYIIDDTVDIEEDVELIEAYTQIPIVPFKKIEAAAHLMFTIANRIAQKGYVNIIQNEFHEQSIQLSRSKSSQASLENALKLAEQKILQSQINRQFLIQVLNTVGNLAYLEKAQKTEDLAFTLIDVVKFLINHIGKEVTIQEEVDYLNNYLALQKARLGDRFTYEINVADNTKTIFIPSMLLQPIVENAIVHGIETSVGLCSIKLQVYIKDEKLEIIIEDNGIGMSGDVLESILTSSSSEPYLKMNLKVLKERLIGRYGNRAYLQISSQEGIGTLVKVTLPLEEM